VSMLCNDAELFHQEGVWKVEGDPTEGALYPFATKLGMDRQAEQSAHPRVDAIPFESEHKFMATLHKTAGGPEMLLVKGAPEVILDHCDRQQTVAGQQVSLSRDHFMEASDKLAGQPTECPRHHSLRSRTGPCSWTPSGPAVSIDCIKQAGQKTAPDQRHNVNLPLASRGPSTEDILSFIVLPLPPRQAAVAGSRAYRKWRGAALLRGR
jgi:hypothetical protein